LGETLRSGAGNFTIQAQSAYTGRASPCREGKRAEKLACQRNVVRGKQVNWREYTRQLSPAEFAETVFTELEREALEGAFALGGQDAAWQLGRRIAAAHGVHLPVLLVVDDFATFGAREMMTYDQIELACKTWSQVPVGFAE